MLIAVAHQKGGTSKTTIAFNLAVELNASQCFDLDPDKGGTTGLKFLSEVRTRLGHQDLNVKQVHNKEELAEAINSDNDDIITVMDLGGLDSDINRIALGFADIVISPANDSILEIGGISEFSKILSEVSEKVGRKITAHTIAARTHHAKRTWPDIKNACANTDNMTFSGEAMPNYSGFADSLAKGLSIKEYSPESSAALHMHKVAKYIKGLEVN